MDTKNDSSVCSGNTEGGLSHTQNNNIITRNSLAVQWLGFLTITARDVGSIPVWGTKTPRAAWCNNKKQSMAVLQRSLLSESLKIHPRVAPLTEAFLRKGILKDGHSRLRKTHNLCLQMIPVSASPHLWHPFTDGPQIRECKKHAGKRNQSVWKQQGVTRTY